MPDITLAELSNMGLDLLHVLYYAVVVSYLWPEEFTTEMKYCYLASAVGIWIYAFYLRGRFINYTDLLNLIASFSDSPFTVDCLVSSAPLSSM